MGNCTESSVQEKKTKGGTLESEEMPFRCQRGFSLDSCTLWRFSKWSRQGDLTVHGPRSTVQCPMSNVHGQCTLI
jgi:hypothetical protein